MGNGVLWSGERKSVKSHKKKLSFREILWNNLVNHQQILEYLNLRERSVPIFLWPNRRASLKNDWVYLIFKIDENIPQIIRVWIILRHQTKS